MKTSIDFCIY